MGAWVHVLYGTIFMSSTIFLFSFDTLEVAGCVPACTKLCRIVVSFEIHEITKRWFGQMEHK